MSFHSNVVKYSEKYIQLYHPQYVIMANRFWEKRLAYFEVISGSNQNRANH